MRCGHAVIRFLTGRFTPSSENCDLHLPMLLYYDEENSIWRAKHELYTDQLLSDRRKMS